MQPTSLDVEKIADLLRCDLLPECHMVSFPGKSFGRMFENLLSGRRLSPVSAYIATTASCPYDCWHCSFKNRAHGDLSTEVWLSIIRGLHGLGASIIGFTGGEPMARADLPDLVAAAEKGGASPIVFTSGALMDIEKARRLKRAGLWAFCVSLDHPDPLEFDRLWGADGAFDRAMKALRISRESGFHTMIGTVATPTLVEENRYADIYNIARDSGVHEFRLIEPMPCGMLAGTGEDNLLTGDHIDRLRKFHLTVNRKGRLPKVCAFNHIESPEIFGCGAGTQHMFVDSAGEVCPCDFTPMSFGNAVREPMNTIWDRMNTAMGNPRRHCFIQKHHRLLSERAESGYPLPPHESEKICGLAGHEPLPDFFALVTGNGLGRQVEPERNRGLLKSMVHQRMHGENPKHRHPGRVISLCATVCGFLPKSADDTDLFDLSNHVSVQSLSLSPALVSYVL